MSAPAVQQFFTTPVIEADLAALELSAVVEAAKAIAARHTFDVSQPASPRFEWEASAREIVLAAGEIQPLSITPGQFWVAMCRTDPDGDAGEVMIEDPRAATMSAGLAGLGISNERTLERISVPPAALLMLQAFLRHALANPTRQQQRWAVIELKARRTGG